MIIDKLKKAIHDVIGNSISIFISSTLLLVLVILLHVLRINVMSYFSELDYIINFITDSDNLSLLRNQIYLIDIDDETMQSFPDFTPGRMTPRQLQADILSKINGAKVIILDFNYIDPSDGDSYLRSTLKNCKQLIILNVKVLMSESVYFPTLYPTIFDDLVDEKHIFMAQSLLNKSFFGINGVYSNVVAVQDPKQPPIKIPSVSLLALALANNKSVYDIRELNTEVERINFRVSPVDFENDKIKKFYKKISASRVLHGDVEFSDNSIVIVSSSYDRASSFFKTPLGWMSKGTILANCLLHFQLERIVSPPLLASIFFDIFIFVPQSLALSVMFVFFEKLRIYISPQNFFLRGLLAVLFFTVKIVLSVIILWISIYMLYRPLSRLTIGANYVGITIPIFVAIMDILYDVNKELIEKIKTVIKWS